MRSIDVYVMANCVYLISYWEQRYEEYLLKIGMSFFVSIKKCENYINLFFRWKRIRMGLMSFSKC
jgi:hypothetical protein